jgi:UDP-N-acetylmuramoyl-L-alanyl-D-glutamate--2,6-diaminopimelate ligase
VTFQELIAGALIRKTNGDLSVAVRSVQCDSRKIEAGDIFVALEGRYHDGAKFIADAIERGAVGLVLAKPPETAVDVPWVVVPHVAEALGRFAATVSGDPSQSLQLVGVTGTNGKTTTCTILETILQTARKNPGLIGTAVGARYAGTVVDTGLTTPEAPALQALLADMVQKEVQVAAMEVSSHGIAMSRVEGTSFAVGVFTGLGTDHLDFHETREIYGETKVNWLLGLRENRACLGVVVPADDEFGREVHSEFRREVLTYGWDDDADIYPAHLELDFAGTKGRIATPEGTLTLSFRLAGKHNVRNAMAAIGAALLLGIEPIDIVDGLGRVRTIPGRFEPIENSRGFDVLIDYAHTPDALTTALASLRELCQGRVIVVFGCGGDRDKEKRPLMAKAVYANSDLMVVTSDNPRSEDPSAIISEVLLGVPVDAEPGRIAVESDRRIAIATAIESAGPGDVVLIAGKGHETGQTIGEEVHPFDDRAVATEILGANIAPKGVTPS